MSWASRRKAAYAIGVILFFTAVIGGPIAYVWLNKPATCFDGILNQTETAVDRGGPCDLLDERFLSAPTVTWARAFQVREGSYNLVAYVQNANTNAGAVSVPYRFGLYDDSNVLIAEKFGTTYLMPGGVTPVFVGDVSTGNRVVGRTYFELIEPPVWKRMKNAANVISINNKELVDMATMPRLTAEITNGSVSDLRRVTLIAVVFDTAGNAFAASRTEIDRIVAGQKQYVLFTWPDAFTIQKGQMDIIPTVAPVRVSAAEQSAH